MKMMPAHMNSGMAPLQQAYKAKQYQAYLQHQQYQEYLRAKAAERREQPEPEHAKEDDDNDDLDSLSTATAPFPEYNEVEAERTKEKTPEYEFLEFRPPQPGARHPFPLPRGMPVQPAVQLPATLLPPQLRFLTGMHSGSDSPDTMRSMMEPKVSASIGYQGSSPIRPTTNNTDGDKAHAKAYINTIPSGVSLSNHAENDSTAYHSNVYNGSSSSNAPGNHSSKGSSTGSAVINSMRNEQIRMSSDLASLNMHMSELSQDNVHVRSARELLSESTASSLSGSTGHFYGGQYTPSSYISSSRPATAGSDGYMPGGLSTRSGAGYQPGPFYGDNNTVWNPNGPGVYGGVGATSSAPAFATTTPLNFGNPPGVAEPVQMYRATTYPLPAPRISTGVQRSTGYGGSGFPQGQVGYNSYNPNQTPYGPIGSRLNANATEFNHETAPPEPWNPSHLGKHVYLHPAQPVNWRHLLEPGVTTSWDQVVDKIISNNDQQASIFLQQKIKNSDNAIKDAIIESIIKRGLELMGNRFGNFLIQRVFECANHAQIMGLATHIEGHTVRLSTDAFGCHVIQKAFDCVPESFKHQMVRELLTRIRDTIVHRYACHVWQKLFELRWQGPPPMIMGTVNAALVGQWTQVAVGETGSLVVQNIFENCNEEDKRPCIDEVLANLDCIARGQYGNWCIQHICEHGSPNDRNAAISMVLGNAADYSMDQYASKCIEKCLKVCGTEFLDGYLERVLMRCPGENFSPLVQIARDQYGNFLIQWILNNASPHLRDIVQAEIRKHLVSLRGNKYGSKVALTCGYGPQGVRPGVPFAPAHHRHHLPGSRGPTHQQHHMPNNSPTFATPYPYGQLDGAAAGHPGVPATYYPPHGRAYPSSQYGSGAGPYNQY